MSKLNDKTASVGFIYRHIGETMNLFSVLSQAKGETNPESLNGDTLQANLIMPEPCHFLNPSLGPVAIIRDLDTKTPVQLLR